METTSGKRLTVLTAMALALVALVSALYVCGYFASSSQASFANRYFDAKWQYDLYRPAMAVEEFLTGERVVGGYRDVPTEREGQKLDR